MSAALWCPLDGRRGCPPGGAEACTATYGRPCYARLEADHGEADMLAEAYGTTPAAARAVLTLGTWHAVHDDATVCASCGRPIVRYGSALHLPSGAGPYCSRRCAVTPLCAAAAGRAPADAGGTS